MTRRVEVEVSFDENEEGKDVVEVTCGRCDHTETSYGHSPKSVRRCLALLRENCPEQEGNFYTDPEENDVDD